jgi:hypothetical protein
LAAASDRDVNIRSMTPFASPIRRVGHTYRYYLTSLGRRALIAARKLTEHLIIPTLQPVAP